MDPLAVIYVIAATLSFVALGGTILTAFNYDFKSAASWGMFATGFGVLTLPACALSAGLEQMVAPMFAYTILAGAMAGTCFCGAVLHAMDRAVSQAPVIDEEEIYVSTLDPATAPAALSLAPLFKRFGNVHISLPGQHAHA